MNVLVKCDMSASSLESYVWIAAVDAVGGASSSEVGGVSSLDAAENCTICGANRSVSVVLCGHVRVCMVLVPMSDWYTVGWACMVGRGSSEGVPAVVVA